MLGVERRNAILALLNEKRSVLVPELAQMFAVTEETIRRDLKHLESKGVLYRTHGGAVLTDDTKIEAPLEIREGINVTGKDAIGRYAAGLVEDYDTIFLDASTSALYVAKHIKDKKGLTVITNAERIIFELSGVQDITLICSGGSLRKSSLSYVGRHTEDAIKNYFANKLFFSCKGFSPKRGLTDSNEQESEIRKTMLQCSEKVVFLCDHTKFDKVGFVQTAKVEDVDLIIIDSAPPAEWDEFLSENASKMIQI